MGFTLYSLIEAALLCVNAIAILNERRLLAKWSAGANRPTYPGAEGGGYLDESQNVGGMKQQLLSLIRSVRTVMRVPLIAFNIVTIVLLILFG